MIDTARPSSDLPAQGRLLEAWAVLREAGFLQTSGLPYFRSLARLPQQPGDLLRFLRGSRQAHRAAWPDLYYYFLRRRHPLLFDLFALFSLGREIPRGRFEEAVGAAGAQTLVSAGFAHFRGAGTVPLTRIYLWEAKPFLHDAPGSGLPLTERAYMARDSLRFADDLAAGMDGRRFARALDLGTGCGLQAQVAAGCSDEVIAVDQNERALAYARANAAINGVRNIRFVRSDLAAQVEGRFDLVVSNPPFLYLPRPLAEGDDPASDGGRLGIGVSRRILESLPSLLQPGGEARILTSLPGWPRRPVLERWIERRLLPQGLEVRLRLVEYLWRDDQLESYRARGIGTPPLAVAEVRRSGRPRLAVTRMPPSERLIHLRKRGGESLRRRKRRAGALAASVRPARLGRVLPLGLACGLGTARLPVPPARLALEPTTACPLDCVSCARAERIADPQAMDTGRFTDVLGSVRPRIVHFHGCGDPLAHPEIDRMCAAARACGAIVALLTSIPNESMLPAAERSLPHLDRLIIGVDAVRPATYASIRGGGDLDVLRAGIRSLRRTRARLGLARPTLVLTFLLLGRNYTEAPAFVRWAYRAGADAALFLTLDLYTIESRRESLLVGLRPEELFRVLVQAKAVADRIGLSTNLGLLLDSPELLDHRYGGKSLPPSARCLRPWLSTYVTVDGRVRPCSRYAYDNGADLGNIFRQSFQSEIWNGPAYRSLRADLASGRPTFRACPNCAVPLEEGGLLGHIRRRRRSP